MKRNAHPRGFAKKGLRIPTAVKQALAAVGVHQQVKAVHGLTPLNMVGTPHASGPLGRHDLHRHLWGVLAYRLYRLLPIHRGVPLHRFGLKVGGYARRRLPRRIAQPTHPLAGVFAPSQTRGQNGSSDHAQAHASPGMPAPPCGTTCAAHGCRMGLGPPQISARNQHHHHPTGRQLNDPAPSIAL